jgi:hypothetical protein
MDATFIWLGGVGQSFGFEASRRAKAFSRTAFILQREAFRQAHMGSWVTHISKYLIYARLHKSRTVE